MLYSPIQTAHRRSDNICNIQWTFPMALIGVTLISAPSEGAQVKQHSQFSWSHGGSGWVLAEAIWIKTWSNPILYIDIYWPHVFMDVQVPPLEMRIGFWPAQQDLPDKSLRSFTGWFGLLPQRNGCKGCGSAAPYGWWFPSKFLIDLAPQLYSFQLRVKRNEANMSIAGCPFAVIYYTYIYIDAPKQKLPTQWLHHAIWKGLAVQFYSQKPPNGSDASNGGDDAGLPASNAEHRSPIMLLKRGKRGIQPEISGILALLNKSKHPNRNNTTKFTNARRAFSP